MQNITAVMSQVSKSPLSALTFQFAYYLKKQPNGLLLIISHISYSKVWSTSIVAPTLLLIYSRGSY